VKSQGNERNVVKVVRSAINLTLVTTILLAACGLRNPGVDKADSSRPVGSVSSAEPSTTAATPATALTTATESLERLARSKFGGRYAGVGAISDLVVVFVAGSDSSDPLELDGRTIKHVTYSYADLEKAMDKVRTVAPTLESAGHPLFELGIDLVTNSVLLVVPDPAVDGPAFLAAMGSGPYRFAVGSQPSTS
jgi:hypothetical protein